MLQCGSLPFARDSSQVNILGIFTINPYFGDRIQTFIENQRCPLWVDSGHFVQKVNNVIINVFVTSAMVQKRTLLSLIRKSLRMSASDP